MLFRDVLDNQIVDKNRAKVGKVDGIVAVVRKDRPPRIAYIECGPTVLARRLHPKLAEWVTRMLSSIGPRRSEPVRIPWARVSAVDMEVEVDLDVQEERNLGVLDWEYWLRDNIIGKIPGAK